MTVHFIGAGPGAADLITLRGRDLIARSPVCLYAGSLVPTELLAHCPPGARIVDTAPMTLDEIVAEIAAAHEAGQDVARLHSGDLSIWSAMGEQTAPARALGIPYDVTPGVPAFAAAAAALRRELTAAGSRAIAGADAHLGPRLGDAGARDARRLRRHRRDARDPSVDPCARQGRRGADAVLRRGLPGRVVFRASWPDERIVRGTLADHRRAAGGGADGAHGADPGRRGAGRARISAKARSTIPTIGAAIAGDPRMNAARKPVRASSAPVAVEHHDLQPPRAGRAPGRRRPGGRRRRRAARSKPAARASSKACLAVLASRDRRPVAGARRASQSRSTSPRLECRSSRPWPSLVILATPPATVTRGDGMRGADI